MTDSLSIYNTLTGQKALFKPLTPGLVKLYVCGITVYDYCHIGHGRVLVAFDVITRYLRYLGYEVHYVSNITDIDDKIIHRALENKEDWKDLTTRFIQAMQEDKKKLGVKPPTDQPKATDYIPQMIDMIQTLIDKNLAYKANNGDVYYNVARFKNYGQLAHQNLEELRAGNRIEVDAAKHGPLDFVLWKLTKPNEPFWESPWGPGRPGWHIECAAMATHLLGSPIDIHGGGLDLQFPHHQNELAQAEAACDCPFVNHWMHVGHVQVNHEKMSKSLGNFFTIRHVFERYNPEVVRYFMAASHYRSPVSYTEEHLVHAQQALQRLYTALRDLPQPERADEKSTRDFYEKRFKEKMNDDFNTPEAWGVLFDLARDINRSREQGQMQEAAQLGVTLKHLGSVLGFLQQDPALFLQTGGTGDKQAEWTPQELDIINALITERNQARQHKDWATADSKRDELNKMGVILEDGADGKIYLKRRKFQKDKGNVEETGTQQQSSAEL